MSSGQLVRTESEVIAQKIRVRGLVQGVGFRPCVWRLAKDLGITGSVINDADGVLIEAWGSSEQLNKFQESIRNNGLPLARVEKIEISSHSGAAPDDFMILKSNSGDANTAVAAEAASCAACIEESLSPFNRRYRYPFTNCTHCGPRLSIVKSIPYDRKNTSMSVFPLCAECAKEYEDPADRRYHAQPTACHACGPKAVLRRTDGRAMCIENLTQLDDVDAAATLIMKGEIIAIKSLGGYQLCCDATNDEAVKKLRQRKKRFEKPFALMARNVEIIRKFCEVTDSEDQLLHSTSSPIVLLNALPAQDQISAAVAPGIATLGFMLPNTPLHYLLLKRINFPIVCSSGNLSEEPQCIDNSDAQTRLGEIADYILDNNRDIVNRLDDSVLRFAAGSARMLRRSRGYAPAPFHLPPGFNQAPQILAMGAELKNTLCLIKGDSAILTQHIGDLADALTFADYKKNLALYENLFQHQATQIVVDRHPEYLSTKYGKQLRDERKIELVEIQHHHAHVAACLAENNVPLDTDKILGVALDGLGLGDDGAFWGGEFLLADYAGYERLGTFKPVALIGGTQAMKEPWRNTYAHIMAEMGWANFRMNFEELELTEFLESKPLQVLSGMLKSQTNVPLASSCGRLFDAVAAAIGICREKASYEGQAAMELESIADKVELYDRDDTLAYPFAIPRLGGKGLRYIEPLAMWQAVLGDMILKTDKGIMSARFHKGLARAVVHMVCKLTGPADERQINTIALTGGVFQNRILLEQVVSRLESDGYNVLTHKQTPANDGSIALGQAVIAAARNIKQTRGS